MTALGRKGDLVIFGSGRSPRHSLFSQKAKRERQQWPRSRRSRQELWPAAFGRSAPELLLRTYSKTFGMTLPGLNKPFGSSACLIERISESSTSDLYCRISATRYWPIPCSALKVPPKLRGYAISQPVHFIDHRLLVGKRVPGIETEQRDKVQVPISEMADDHDADTGKLLFENRADAAYEFRYFRHGHGDIVGNSSARLLGRFGDAVADFPHRRALRFIARYGGVGKQPARKRGLQQVFKAGAKSVVSGCIAQLRQDVPGITRVQRILLAGRKR